MIRFITTTTRPKAGEIVTGNLLKEAKRGGFVTTEIKTTVKVNHVVDSKFAPNGYYVIGNTGSK